MGKGKKNRGGSKQLVTNQQLLMNPPQAPPNNSLTQHTACNQKQEMSERNLVQEEGFESDDEKNNGKSSMVKVDIRGSDSEEDNAAAGGGLDSNGTGSKENIISQHTSHTNLHKKKNKEANTKLYSPVTDQRTSGPSITNMSLPMSAGDCLAPQNNMHPMSCDRGIFNYEQLGRIVMRLLPAEHQAEQLPDGRYVMTAAAIGYLAQKLGH